MSPVKHQMSLDLETAAIPGDAAGYSTWATQNERPLKTASIQIGGWVTRDGSAERAEDMVARRRAGQTLRQIGLVYGLSESRVSRIIRRWLFSEEMVLLDVEGTQSVKARVAAHNEPRWADMKQRRLAGQTLAEIGEAYGLTGARISQILTSEVPLSTEEREQANNAKAVAAHVKAARLVKAA